MAVGNPRRTLASLDTLDELSPVRHMADVGLGCGRLWRVVWDGTFTQLSPDALLREPSRQPWIHGLQRRHRDMLRVLRGGIVLPRIVFTEHGHCDAFGYPLAAAAKRVRLLQLGLVQYRSTRWD
jgi:hypothetical protein